MSEWNLPAESELRCEVKEKENLSLYLVEGSAEIFGVELAVNTKYTFHDENIAVFSWRGCKLRTEGNCEAIYTSNETPMVSIVNLNAYLEARRDVAMANGEQGPRVLIVGPHDSGKSTTARILSVYATRLDRCPIFVDLDCGSGSLGLPGCVGAIPLDKTSFTVDEGDFANGAPLLYYFGHTSPKDNVDLMKHMSGNLAEKVSLRQERDAAAKSSGIIVTSTGWIDGGGLDLLTHIIRTFKINVVIVNGHDRLYSSLQTEASAINKGLSTGPGDEDHSSSIVTVIKLMRSGGAVQRTDSDRRRLRKTKIHDYFYGTRRVEAGGMSGDAAASGMSVFSPSRVDLQLHRYTLLRCSDEKLSLSMVPLGGQATSASLASGIRLTPTAATLEMENCILGVLYTPTASVHQTEGEGEDDMGVALLNSNIAGFVYVVKVDLDMNVLTVLSPSPGPLPGSNLVLGTIKWVE